MLLAPGDVGAVGAAILIAFKLIVIIGIQLIVIDIIGIVGIVCEIDYSSNWFENWNMYCDMQTSNINHCGCSLHKNISQYTNIPANKWKSGLELFTVWKTIITENSRKLIISINV